MDTTGAGPRPRTTAAFVAALLTAGLALAAGCTNDPATSAFDTGPRRQPSWSVRLPDGLGKPRLGQVAGDAVVVQAEKGAVILARSDGAVRWQRREVAPGAGLPEIAGIAGNTMAVGYGDRVELIDLGSGAERARVGRNASFAPRVTATGVYVVGASGSNRPVVAYDLAGNRRWQHDFTGVVELTMPADVGYSAPFAPLPDGRPLLVTVRPGAATDPYQVVSLSPDTGAEITRFGGPNGFDPIKTPGARQAGGTLLVWNDESTSSCRTPAAGYDGGTGAKVWTGTVGLHDLWRGGSETGCGQRWTPRVAGERVLTTDVGGTLQVVDAATGAARWRGPLDTYPLTATADTVLGRAGNGRTDLAALDAGNGTERWRLRLPDIHGSPQSLVNRQHAVAGDAFVLTISVPADDVTLGGRVTVLDARTGSMRWSAPPGGNLLGAGADGVVTTPVDTVDGDPTTISYFPLG